VQHGDTRDADNRAHPSCAHTASDARDASDQSWEFRPPHAATYTVHVRSSHDVVVAIYSRGRELLCDDDSVSVAQSRFTFEFAANQPYTIVVDGFNGEAGPYDLSVNALQ
jgi:hypothetical protein